MSVQFVKFAVLGVIMAKISMVAALSLKYVLKESQDEIARGLKRLRPGHHR